MEHFSTKRLASGSRSEPPSSIHLAFAIGPCTDLSFSDFFSRAILARKSGKAAAPADKDAEMKAVSTFESIFSQRGQD